MGPLEGQFACWMTSAISPCCKWLGGCCENRKGEGESFLWRILEGFKEMVLELDLSAGCDWIANHEEI